MKFPHPHLLIAFLFLSLFSYSQNYSWEKGYNDNTGSGIYLGYDTVSPATLPMGRAEAAHFTDKKGNFWIFGGDRTLYTSSKHYMSDLLFFNPDTRNWVLKKGPFLTENDLGVYGQQGIEAPTNQPGARRNAASWCDTLGNLWVFGGIGYSETVGPNMLNDLWRYNMATNNWTYMKGSKQLMQQGNWGTQGTPDSQNTPGARQGALTWVDKNGDLWLFGGYGFNSNGSLNQLADLWRYNIATNNWTWVTGNSQNPFGLYNTVGTTGRPGGRTDAGCWKDPQGNFWLYGGFGFTDATGTGYKFLSDLWKYDPTTNVWTWVKGSKYTDVPANRGTKGVSTVNNTPGGRWGFAFTSDPQGNFWILGGIQTDGNALADTYGDLWKYEPATNRWTWMNGSAQYSSFSVYGTYQVPNPNNTPGARLNSCGWTDRFGHLWFFGGNGRDGVSTNYGFMNDLWRYGNCMDGTFSVTATAEQICTGESVTLTIVPTRTVNWSTAQVDSVLAVSPLATTVYSANVSDNYGCNLELTQQVEVSTCESISEQYASNTSFSLYPNPNNGSFTISQNTSNPSSIIIYDATGRLMHRQTLSQENTRVFINLKPGVYFIMSNDLKNKIKFIVE